MTAPRVSGLSETGALCDVVLKHPRDAFVSDAAIARQWRDLRFTAPPDFARAVDEYDAFVRILESAGARIHWLPAGDETSLDSIYVRDASVVFSRGVVLARMGKALRAAEPREQGTTFETWAIPIAGAIEPPGRLEGGDVVWLDDRTVAVGEGYRTDADGIRQLRALLGDTIETLIPVPLPHWRGQEDVFHLMSILSPVDRDLAVAYSPLMPVPFRTALLDRGIALVDVPDAEFDSMGANVLALAPRRCVMLDGNPRTRAALEEAGAEVHVYAGTEISLKGGGGPTCLTRPLSRAR
ncbi:MAG TPA: arginine deiminase family protein [Vicinamibacterales bacterium]|nr:arginine deiminase family protein [Vicinamibacterales bacterium]